MVDAHDSKSCEETHEGSIPSFGTMQKHNRLSISAALKLFLYQFLLRWIMLPVVFVAFVLQFLLYIQAGVVAEALIYNETSGSTSAAYYILKTLEFLEKANLFPDEFSSNNVHEIVSEPHIGRLLGIVLFIVPAILWLFDFVIYKITKKTKVISQRGVHFVALFLVLQALFLIPFTIYLSIRMPEVASISDALWMPFFVIFMFYLMWVPVKTAEIIIDLIFKRGMFEQASAIQKS